MNRNGSLITRTRELVHDGVCYVEAGSPGIKVAEGMGFEPMNPLSRVKRLAGARTRPLCDPSLPFPMISKALKRINSIQPLRFPGPGTFRI